MCNKKSGERWKVTHKSLAISMVVDVVQHHGSHTLQAKCAFPGQQPWNYQVGILLVFRCDDTSFDWELIGYNNPEPNDEYVGAKQVAKQDGWIWKDK